MSRAFEQRTFDFDDDGDDGVDTVRYDGRRGGGAVLAPGQRLVVPLRLMDGSPNPDLTPTQRLVAQDAAERQQARRLGLKDASDLHRPGFRFQTDAAGRDAKARAYHDYESTHGEAWRSRPTGEGADGQIGQRAGCVADDSFLGEDHALDDREGAHLEYETRLTNAWRSADAGGVADHRPARRGDQMPTRDAVERAYQEHDEWLRNAWRNQT